MAVRAEFRDAPASFYCQYSKRIMTRPYLADCAHLFDEAVIDRELKCPHDQATIVNCLPVPQLAEKIARWKETRSEKEVERPDVADEDWRAAPVRKTPIVPSLEIKKAHQDDIHGFIQPFPGRFVSGSKDTAIKIWNVDGTLFRQLRSKFHASGYQYWITALAPFEEGVFASGSRDGYISIWDEKGVELQTIEYSPSARAKQEYVAKQRNKQRINCIVYAGANRFYTGTPKYVQLWNARNGRMITHWEADQNDWVYCIEPMKEDEIITVIGARMEHWTNIFDGWKKSSLITEERDAPWIESRQRPHISAMVRLQIDRNLLSSALFDGSVRVVDIAAQRVIKTFKEHERRVWSVIELAPQWMASSADDATIKIWDLRQDRSVHTLRGNPGRVSALLKVSDNVFISGSCPDKVFESAEKASIRFWDLRKVIGE